MAIKYSTYDSTLNQSYVDSQQNYQGAYLLSEKEVEVQRTNNFEFIVVNDFSDATDNYDEVIRLSVNKAFVPHYNQSSLTVKRGNTSIKFAGVPEFSDGDINCYDYVGINTLKALRKWQSLSYNVDTEKVGLVSDYKKNCQIYEYTPDGQTVRIFELYGCWFSNLREDEFNSETNAIHGISVTITYDKAKEIEPGKRSSV